MARPKLNPNVEDMQRVVERMARAQWITGTNLVSPEEVSLSFTKRGKARVRELRQLLRKHAPMACLPPRMCTYDPHSVPPVAQGGVLKLAFEVAVIFADLEGPLPPGEEDSFMAWLWFYAREEKDLLAGRNSTTRFAVPGMEQKKPAIVKFEEFPAYMEKVAESLRRIGWIRGKSIIAIERTCLTFTAAGRERLQVIRKIFRRIEDVYAQTPAGAMMETEPDMTPDDFTHEMFFTDVSDTLRPLDRSTWSDGEELIFRQLLWSYSRMDPDPLAEGPATVGFPIPSLTFKIGPDKKGKSWD